MDSRTLFLKSKCTTRGLTIRLLVVFLIVLFSCLCLFFAFFCFVFQYFNLDIENKLNKAKKGTNINRGEK